MLRGLLHSHVIRRYLDDSGADDKERLSTVISPAYLIEGDEMAGKIGKFVDDLLADNQRDQSALVASRSKIHWLIEELILEVKYARLSMQVKDDP
jgi:hypothetical protein